MSSVVNSGPIGIVVWDYWSWHSGPEIGRSERGHSRCISASEHELETHVCVVCMNDCALQMHEMSVCSQVVDVSPLVIHGMAHGGKSVMLWALARAAVAMSARMVVFILTNVCCEKRE